MAKRKRGLDLPPAYEALKKAKELAGAGEVVQPLRAAPAVADLSDVAAAAKPAKKRKSSQAEVEQTAEVASPSAPATGQTESPEDGPGAALAAERATAAAEGSDEQPQRKAKAGKGAPVLPWMRLPIDIEPGTGVALEGVKGLDARLLAGLRACAPVLFNTPDGYCLVLKVVMHQLAAGACTFSGVTPCALASLAQLQEIMLATCFNDSSDST